MSFSEDNKHLTKEKGHQSKLKFQAQNRKKKFLSGRAETHTKGTMLEIQVLEIQ